jgi:hypothetical protein
MLVGGNEIVEVVVTNVLYVPRLAKKLFSVTKAISFGKCRHKVVGLGLRENGLY